MAAPDPAGATLTIDLDAIAANFQILRARLGSAACAAVVKADGYGLGAAPIATRLAHEGCRDFFVAQLEEAISLRTALSDGGLDAAIYVLNGLVPGAEAEYIAHRIFPVLNQPTEIDAWAQAGRAGDKAVTAILHVDTGMARLGLTPENTAALARTPDRLNGIDLRYVMSHLACTSEPDNPMNQLQRDRFSKILAGFPGVPGSLANSSGIFLGTDFHFAMARPGAALYGVQPLDGESKLMEQVINLQGKILQCRFVDTGQTVGYGATHIVTRRSRIATVGLGYADGFLRSLGNRASGYVDGIRVPMAGRVSMDLITFDVTDIPEDLCRPGDTVELIGSYHGVDDLAAEAGTIGYEILTSLGARYHRRYLGQYQGPHPDVA
jgi:alanine racemase